MTRARTLSLLLALLLAAMAGGCGRAQAGEGSTAACLNLEVSSAEETGGLAAESFSATRTVDLTFTVKFKKGFTGEHVLELRVLTPDGNLYRTLTTPIIAGPDGVAKSVTLAGHRRPVAQRQARPLGPDRRGPSAVDVALPVAGTDILSAGLYGAWRVEARLDGGQTACKLGTTFTLTE
jgi:hypothetical protein